MQEICRLCQEFDKPLIMNAGREPKSQAYPCEPYAICSADKLERVLKTHPGLRVCVPRMGADEFDTYHRLTDSYDNLWLDTTMTWRIICPSTTFPTWQRCAPIA